MPKCRHHIKKNKKTHEKPSAHAPPKRLQERASGAVPPSLATTDDAGCTVLLHPLPDKIITEQLWIEFQRFGSIVDACIEPENNFCGRTGLVRFSNASEALHAVQEAKEVLCMLGIPNTCKIELEHCHKGMPSHDPSGKRRRTQSRSCEVKSSGGGTLDVQFARKALQALGPECVKAGQALREECTVKSDGSGAVDGCRIFQIESAAGSARVTLHPQAIGVGDKVGECTCWLHGHCKHVAAAVLTVIAEDRENNQVGIQRLLNPKDPDAHCRRDMLESGLRQRSMEDLRGFLRLNNMLLAGTKPVLARRVADGIVFGAIVGCPNCGGQLHPCTAMDSPSSTYVCRRVTKGGKQCGYEVDGAELLRKHCVGAAQFE
jgi:hypothetical protein